MQGTQDIITSMNPPHDNSKRDILDISSYRTYCWTPQQPWEEGIPVPSDGGAEAQLRLVERYNQDPPGFAHPIVAPKALHPRLQGSAHLGSLTS